MKPTDYKQLFYLPQGTYLLSHSVGCLPRITYQMQRRFFEQWKTKGDGAWDDWLGAIDRFRHSLANLFNGQAADFCPQANISAAVSKIVASLPPRPGKKQILISELDFPSVGFALQQAERAGYHIVKMPAVDGEFPLAKWRAYLGQDTQMALITHSLYGNSYLNQVGKIIELARQREIFTIVDIAQSAGVVPIDLRQWDADFVVGSCIKWLCGGPGAGFLWADPSSVAQFRPTDVGWFSHENPFEFDLDHFVYAADARRFWGGTPSVLPYVLASASAELISQIGVNSIRAHNQALTTLLVRRAQRLGLRLLNSASAQRRGGTVCIGFDRPGKALELLKEAGILVDYRPASGVRFSPHIYTDREEIERVGLVLDRLSEYS